MTARPNGCFIVIEGPDGCGKSTVSVLLRNLLQERGQQHDWALIQDPSEGPVGKLLREFLASGRPYELDALGYLFMADRMHQSGLWQQPYLVADRYMLSTFAYQYDRMPHKLLLHCLADQRLRTPDVVVVLDAPIDLCLKRVHARCDAAATAGAVATAEVFESSYVLERVIARYRRSVRDGLVSFFCPAGALELSAAERKSLGVQRLVMSVEAGDAPMVITMRIYEALERLLNDGPTTRL